MRRRCLIIGASGQLGRALCAAFRPHHEVLEATHRSQHTTQWPIDLGDPSRVVAVVGELHPEWIIIAGAFCNVDRAEMESATCLAVNAEGPRALAEYASQQGCTLVYYSTDYVFDGSRALYSEPDQVAPMNAYARSKVEGEAAVRALLPDRHLILRTAWLYGPDERRRNFILRFIDEVKAGRSVSVPSDQWGTPTYTEDLASATRFLLERGETGTFHATGPEWIDRASLARRICETFELDATRCVSMATRELGQIARRPLQVRLDCRKLRAVGVPVFRGIESGLGGLRQWQETLQGVTHG